MNVTVARIVEIMFQDYELSDELLTIKDEVMSNCQERYQDCIDRGLTDDEAIGAVVESLKGMDEVLKDYPKRFSAQRADPSASSGSSDEQEEAAKFRRFDFHLADIRTVDISTLDEDVTITEAPDEQVHVRLIDAPYLRAELEADCLRVFRDALSTGQRGRGRGRVHFNFGDYKGNKDFSLESLSQFVNSFASNFSISFGTADAKVMLELPLESHLPITAKTTSGDVRTENVSFQSLNAKTMSGEIELELPEDMTLPVAKLSTTSGDVDVRGGHVSELTMESMSGDLTASGTLDTVSVKSTSGDVELTGILQQIRSATVSGDTSINPEEPIPLTISLQSTSGDLHVEAPDGATVNARLKSVSGDVRNRCSDMGDSSIIRITASTVSGDIYIE